MVTVIVDKLMSFPRDQIGFAIRLDEATNSNGDGEHIIDVVVVENIAQLKERTLDGEIMRRIEKSTTVVVAVGFADIAMRKYRTNNGDRKFRYVLRKLKQTGKNLIVAKPCFGKNFDSREDINYIKNRL